MRALVLVAALAAPSTVLIAQATQQTPPPAANAEAPAPLPEARTIIDRHIELIGGRKAILGHTSTRATGTMSAPAQGMSGNFEVFAAAPNKALMKITIAGIGEMVEVFDGTHGWSTSAMTGPMLAQGKELEQKRLDADYYSDLHDPARYESIRTVEKTTFDGRPCYKIRIVRKNGDEDLEFYDVAGGLKAGAIISREIPMGKITSTVTAGDYRKFGDILQPTTMRQSAMGIEQVLTFTGIEYDTVDPAVFAMPDPIKALIK
jgi:hypothetical protein